MGFYEFKEQDAYDFARSVGIQTKVKGDELQFKTCPYCKPRGTDKTNIYTFSINLHNGMFKCLRASCNASGNMIILSKDFDFSLGTEVDEYYKPQKKYKKLPQPKEPIVPKPQAIEYLNSRGISEEVANKYQITVQNEHPNVLVFPFFDNNNALQFVKYRDTQYSKEKGGNKEWCEANSRPILFGMKQCNDKFDRLVFTEGQMDSLAVASCGIENAVSVPTGAKGFTWVPYCWDWVCKFDEIIVFGDHEKGHITLLEEIKNRFPNKIRHVREDDYMDCKDANELLVKHGKEAVIKAVENAIQLPIKRVISLSDVKAVDIYKLPKLKTGLEPIDKTLGGGLYFGGVTVLTGKRGHGKSTLGGQLLAQAISQGYTTFAYSGELPNYLFKSWLDFQIAGSRYVLESYIGNGYVDRYISDKNHQLIDKWYEDKAYLYDSSIIEDDEKENLLETIRNAIMQYGVKVILLDNLMTAMYLDEVRGTDKYDQQGTFVRKLTQIALRYGVLIILVAHQRKNGASTDVNDEIGGSGDISNLASVVISYGRDNNIAPDQRMVKIAKNRLFGKIDMTGFVTDYDEFSKRIYTSEFERDFDYGWNVGTYGDMDLTY